MLNISNNPVHVETEKLQSYAKISLYKSQYQFRNWLLFILGLSFILLFFPWTQQIQASGELIMLSPEDRPQNIEAIIGGRIEKWYVSEGAFVKKGDTIVRISETKSEYFDPDIILRTENQILAKGSSLSSYQLKALQLEKLSDALSSELLFKKSQIKNKIEQQRLKIESDKNELEVSDLDITTEKKQFSRTEEMFKEGLKSLSELENKRLKLQQTIAKQVSAQNKLAQSQQELDNLNFQLSSADSEYSGKIAKNQSDKQSTLSDGFETRSNLEKLKSQLSNYVIRAQNYYVLAPQDCYISKATKVGIGEIIKEGEDIARVVPARTNLAVEMFIKPIDLPLARVGTPVRILFDGWPAVFFSGWPKLFNGSFEGKIYAIDNEANDKGKFRVLIAPDTTKKSWPSALRSGGGAQSFALLNDVPVWYEIWRQINGFPPEYYAEDNGNKTEAKSKTYSKKK